MRPRVSMNVPMYSSFKPLPMDNLDWLGAQGVLTEKLKQVQSDTQMTVLSQAWTEPNWWERYVLGSDKRLIRRDILVQASDKPCWFARTLIPEATYSRAPAFFDRLHHEPLSHLIYNQPRVERKWIYSYGIDKNNLEFHWMLPEWRAGAQALWMRLSTLMFDEVTSFYLAEIFLPGLTVCLQSR